MRSILITGGTGSFGQALVAYLLKYYGKKLKRIVVFSRDEYKQFNMANKFPTEKYPQIRYFLGDVRDQNRIEKALQNIECVVHAAALKQITAAEYNPFEFIKTNILGAQNVVEACINQKVKKVVALSTDKAVAPHNLYGSTKLCSDKIFISSNPYSGESLKASVVRYGNVFGSRGSVAPFFKSIKHTGHFPITHKDMTRFNITLEESVKMVDWTINNAIGGEIVVPKLDSFKIVDLAKAINPKSKLKFIGIKRGEKIHEELLNPNDAPYSLNLGKYYVILPDNHKKRIQKYKKFKFKKVDKNFSYTSNQKKFLNINQLKKLISNL
jgi:UDP-N-acetylglucosamine 4,6-dehydratase/5-epimerase